MSAWSPLRITVFRNLWLATIVSNIGTSMNETAAVWTMTVQTGSPTLIALMQTSASLPLFFFALPAGALADLMDRRWLIIFAQTGALLVALSMASLAYFGALTPALLLLTSFHLGVAYAFTVPTWQALIPEIVGRQQLSAAISLGGISFNLARSIGPVLGGMLVAALGPAPVFAFNALSFATVITVLFFTRMDAIPRTTDREQMLGAISAAIRYARHAPPMRTVLIRAALHVFAAVAPVALLPIMIRSKGWSGSDYGMLMGCYGIGAIFVAIFLLPGLRRRFSFDTVIGGAAACSALATLALAFAPERISIGAAMIVAGGSWMAGMNTFSVAAQSAFPSWVRARSSALYLVAIQGSFGLGALLWGRITDNLNDTTALITAATWLLASIAFCRWLPVSHLERLDLTPSGHWTGHDFPTQPEPSDGPVLVTVEYSINPETAVEFAQALKELRRVRLRDGAFRSTVFVDIVDPGVYRESFLVGSWAEHLRQHQRLTVEDKLIEEKAYSFHIGPEPPLVRHFLMVNLRAAMRNGLPVDH